MTSPIRGWVRPRSIAARLAACEQLIGYEFNNLDLLKQALDNRESSSRRLAIIGDRAVETHLARRWWEKKDLSLTQWTEVRTSVLCNENLSNVGFRMRIDECTIPDSCDTSMRQRMATTVEALLAAVWLDTDRDAAAFDKVIDSFGLTHTLLVAGTTRAWWHSPINSRHILPRSFFSGHHASLIKTLSELEQPGTSPMDPTGENRRFAAGDTEPKQEAKPKQKAKPKQEAKPEKSVAPKPVSIKTRTEVEQLYMRIEEDAMQVSQLSRHVPQSKQLGPKFPSGDVVQPKSNVRGVEQARDNAVQAHVPIDQGAEGLTSSGLNAKEDTRDAKQTVHDEGPLFRGGEFKDRGER